jgi:hypothetical protein
VKLVEFFALKLKLFYKKKNLAPHGELKDQALGWGIWAYLVL